MFYIDKSTGKEELKGLSDNDYFLSGYQDEKDKGLLYTMTYDNGTTLTPVMSKDGKQIRMPQYAGKEVKQVGGVDKITKEIESGKFYESANTMKKKTGLPMFEEYQENKEAYDAQSTNEGSEVWNAWYKEKDNPSKEVLDGIHKAMVADGVAGDEKRMISWLEGFTGFDKAMADNLLTQLRAQKIVEGFNDRAKFGDLSNPGKAISQVILHIESNYSISSFVSDQIADKLTDDVYFNPETGEVEEKTLKDVAKLLNTNTRDLQTELSELMADEILESINEANGDTRPLPKEYKHSGMTFQQMKRTQKAAMYKEKDSDTFEVFLIKVAKPATVKAGGKKVEVPQRERIPGNEDFGVWAWSFNDEKAAERKFNEYK